MSIEIAFRARKYEGAREEYRLMAVGDIVIAEVPAAVAAEIERLQRLAALAEEAFAWPSGLKSLAEAWCLSAYLDQERSKVPVDARAHKLDWKQCTHVTCRKMQGLVTRYDAIAAEKVAPQ